MAGEHAAQLVMKGALLLHEHGHAALQILAQQAMQAVAIKADQLTQHFIGQQGAAAVGFLFGNDLQQHAAGDDLTGLGVMDLERFSRQHQALDVFKGNKTALDSVV